MVPACVESDAGVTLEPRNWGQPWQHNKTTSPQVVEEVNINGGLVKAVPTQETAMFPQPHLPSDASAS